MCRTSAWRNVILENNCTTVADCPNLSSKMAGTIVRNSLTQPIFQLLHSAPSKDWLCHCSRPIVVTEAGSGRGHLNFNQSNEFRSASAFIRAQLSWIINLDCCPSCSDKAHPWVESLPFRRCTKQQCIQLRDWSWTRTHCSALNCLWGCFKLPHGGCFRTVGIWYGCSKALHDC